MLLKRSTLRPQLCSGGVMRTAKVIIVLLLTVLAIMSYILYGAPGTEWSIVLVSLVVVPYVLPRIVNFTNEKMKISSGVWGGFIGLAIMLWAFTGWIEIGGSYVRESLTSNYVTITTSGPVQYSYILHEDGAFGVVGDQNRFQEVGRLYGTTLVWEGSSYTLFPVQLVRSLPITGIGPKGLIMITF